MFKESNGTAVILTAATDRLETFFEKRHLGLKKIPK